MTKKEITTRTLANGWQMIDGFPSLDQAIRATPRRSAPRTESHLANVEIKKAARKWEKVSGESYAKIQADPETGIPTRLGLATSPD